MKKQEELVRKLTDLIKETKADKLQWKVEYQTTEYNEKELKPVVEEEGKKWTVDECYTSYYCEYKGEEFFLITYEMIHQCENELKTTNLVFLPPLGIRYFDIHQLLPYAIETNQMLTFHIHSLWEMLLSLKRNNNPNVEWNVETRVLTIDE